MARRTLQPWFFLLFLALCLAARRVRAEAEMVLPAGGTPPAVSTAAADAEPLYVYTGTSRDPFLPLSGGAAGFLNESSGDKEPGAFNPSSLELKGVIKTPTGRWAVLAGPGNERYLVENGKVKDPKKKVVEGFVGIIKEKTVVLIGPNNAVTEMKLKRDEEKDEKK